MSCIVDIGAQKTSISCIEDGFCIPETRYIINYDNFYIIKILIYYIIIKIKLNIYKLKFIIKIEFKIWR